MKKINNKSVDNIYAYSKETFGYEEVKILSKDQVEKILFINPFSIYGGWYGNKEILTMLELMLNAEHIDFVKRDLLLESKFLIIQSYKHRTRESISYQNFYKGDFTPDVERQIYYSIKE